MQQTAGAGGFKGVPFGLVFRIDDEDVAAATLTIELSPGESDVLEDIWYTNFAYFLNVTGLLEYLDLPPDRADNATVLRIGNAFIRNLIALSAGPQRPLPVFEIRWECLGRPFSGFVVDHGSARSRSLA